MIELKNLSFSYGDEPLLSSLSARFEEGGFYGLIGPNGSGKTSLIRLMARQLQPLSGKLFLDGEAYAGFSRRGFARRVAVLPQTRPIPDIPVRELVSHGRFPHLELSRKLAREDEEIVTAAMESLGVLPLAGRELKSLSGGERQKVYLAMLLAQQAGHLLLDEPTSFLDISAAFSLMESLKELKGDGKCVITVLHDLSLAMEYCDKLLVLDKGGEHCFLPPYELCCSGVFERVFKVRCIHSGGYYTFRPL